MNYFSSSYKKENEILLKENEILRKELEECMEKLRIANFESKDSEDSKEKLMRYTRELDSMDTQKIVKVEAANVLLNLKIDWMTKEEDRRKDIVRQHTDSIMKLKHTIGRQENTIGRQENIIGRQEDTIRRQGKIWTELKTQLEIRNKEVDVTVAKGLSSLLSE
ncbi:PREDICTED: uncharacterized protein LOC109190258 [Ipomoea nil]|uniref:uncharacterized protein LOC109190258 n=1 Tax=Ipomoea nil TaxID=35883 RepID=UPI0009013252|nr:PREDICTED: uncharacterized protein LOC109190258 [Ipomoea nil]